MDKQDIKTTEVQPSKSDDKKLYTIEEAAEAFNLHPHYVRKLIREGKVESNPMNVYSTSDKVKKHYVTGSAMTEYLSGVTKSKRQDSRRKYTMYADESEIIQIRKALAAVGFNHNDLLKLTNTK
jgi:hypothetical protein